MKFDPSHKKKARLIKPNSSETKPKATQINMRSVQTDASWNGGVVALKNQAKEAPEVENALYTCPKCGKFTAKKFGNTLTCVRCGVI